MADVKRLPDLDAFEIRFVVRIDGMEVHDDAAVQQIIAETAQMLHYEVAQLRQRRFISSQELG